MTQTSRLRSADRAEVDAICALYGFDLDAAQLDFFERRADAALDSYRRLDELLPSEGHVTPSGWRPPAAKDPFNAWAWRCERRAGNGGGPLDGRRVAVKDIICVAGMPMVVGSEVLEDFVASVDAPVVSRVLDAGATIVGKTTCGTCASPVVAVRDRLRIHAQRPAAAARPATAKPARGAHG